MMDLPVASDSAESPPATTPADIHGLAERLGTGSILGWALDGSRPGHRLQLELRLGDRVISTGVADKPRADLEANGIGDGRHAFELPVEPGLLQRVAEFRLFGLAADGSKQRIPLRIRRPPQALPRPAAAPAPPALAAEEADRLRADLTGIANRLKQLPEAKALHDLLAQQSTLAEQVRRVSTLLDERLAGVPSREQVGDLATAQVTLAAQQAMAAERVATLEAWIARVEQRVADMPLAAATAPKAATTLDPWQKLLFATLVGALAGALLVSMILRAI